MGTISEVLGKATERLLSISEPASESARLDAELLLVKVLGVARSYLFAWPERALDKEQEERFEALLAERQAGQPIAYLLGKQEFWSLPFDVGEGVLIPRPDTETLVELALEVGPVDTAQVLDLGTGSGAIACALAHERSSWQLCAVDSSAEALAYARRNVQALGLHNVSCCESRWFDGVKGKVEQHSFDLIVSNPPYIEADDAHLQRGDLRFEPLEALASGADGLDDIRHIASQAPAFLKDTGWLLLEHGYQQTSAVAELLRQNGFLNIGHRLDLAGHQRVSFGQKCAA